MLLMGGIPDPVTKRAAGVKRAPEELSQAKIVFRVSHFDWAGDPTLQPTTVKENLVYQDRIREIYVHLSPGYRRIADFLLNRYQEAAFMTAAQVGRASDVDTTLVVRFAQRLGYPGFPELIDDIQADVKRDLQAVYEPAPEDNSAAGVLRRTLVEDRNNLEYTLLHMDNATVQKIVDLLDAAPRIFVSGDGSSICLAEAFAMRIVLLGMTAHVISGELSGQTSIAIGARPGDVFLGIGSTPFAVGVAAILKLMRQAGAHTIGIVDSPTNPVAGTAEHVIVAPARTVGRMPSWTSHAAVLHGLMQALALRRIDSVSEWVIKTNQLMRGYVEELEKSVEPMRQAMLALDRPSYE
jgi:DNA-binding MurR/RpiR family transcriptional regulator